MRGKEGEGNLVRMKMTFLRNEVEKKKKKRGNE